MGGRLGAHPGIRERKEPIMAAATVELVGLTVVEIATLVRSGDVTQKAAEAFVADRAKRKLQAKLEQES